MCDVRFGVKLFLAVDAACNLSGSKTLYNCWHTIQKLVSFFLCFNTLIEAAFGAL